MFTKLPFCSKNTTMIIIICLNVHTAMVAVIIQVIGGELFAVVNPSCSS